MLVSSELFVSITSPSFVALHLPVSEIAKCIAKGCLLLFYKNYIVYSSDYTCVFIVRHMYTKFRLDWLLYISVTYMSTTLFTTMFTVILFVCSLQNTCIPSFVLIGCYISKLHTHLYPIHNVWGQLVYCCFTPTTMFTELFTCLHNRFSINSPSFVALHPPVSEIAKCIVYFCFTRTTLFTTMFTVIILVYSLKFMFIPSFVLIDCGVSELHAHLCPYRNLVLIM